MATGRIQKQIDRLLDEAEQASADRNWEIVRDRAQHALTFDPENADAIAFLAAAGRALGDLESAKSAVSSAAGRSPSFSATQRDEPTSFADGRYQVAKFLGEGGKKLVYLAHDKTLDREVAFALIKTEGLDETSRTRITHEAQAMGRLALTRTSSPCSSWATTMANPTSSPS